MIKEEIDIYQIRSLVCERANHSCECCDKKVNLSNGQLAYLMINNEANIKKYKKDIHSIYNLYWSCSVECSKKFKVKNDTLFGKHLMYLIEKNKLEEMAEHRKYIISYKKKDLKSMVL